MVVILLPLIGLLYCSYFFFQISREKAAAAAWRDFGERHGFSFIPVDVGQASADAGHRIKEIV